MPNQIVGSGSTGAFSLPDRARRTRQAVPLASSLPVMCGFYVEELRREADGLCNDMVQALAIAERSALAPELRDTLRVTGTGHLLAISGLHIGLIALCGGVLALVLIVGRG